VPNSFVIPLAASQALSLVGGKGRSLASLTAGGFSVPDGFTITTVAYRRFVEANGLQAAILESAKPEVLKGALAFIGASAGIQKLFADAVIPDEIIAEIRGAYEATAPRVAVRSSATAEDLPDLSFAGQQDTYLNINGVDALLTAVKNCWASLWTARAMSYRHQMGIHHTQIEMAVVVQEMVMAQASGILFTANPATGDRDQMIVNASYGLGEAIVGGEITPDSFIIDRDTLTVTETVLGSKAHMIVADDKLGTRTIDVAMNERDDQSIATAQLSELARLALRVESHFDKLPQDMEWVFADGKLWLVQSRPITNLPPPPLKEVSWDQPEPGAYLGRSQLVEHIPEPVCTLFEDLHMTRSLQHYWGMNLSRRGNHDFEDTQSPYSFIVQKAINGFAYRHLGEPVRAGHPPGPIKRHWLPEALRNRILRFSRAWTTFKMYLLFVPKWRYGALPRYLRIIDRWNSVDPGDAGIEQLWTGMRAMSKADAQYWYNDGVWNAFALARGTELTLANFLQEHADGRFTSGHFLSGLPSVAYDAQVSLWRISQLIRTNSEIFQAVIATSAHQLLDMLRSRSDSSTICNAIAEHFETYGHQIYSLDFIEPSEGENPSRIMQSLLSLVLQEGYDPIASQRELAAKRRASIREALVFFKGRQRWQFIRLLLAARYFYPNREQAMFYMGLAWTVFRPFARELGHRLVDAGTLETPEDIYFLNIEELSSAIRAVVISSSRLAKMRPDVTIPSGIPEYRQLTKARRQLREARRRLTAPVNIPGPPLWSRPPTEDETIEETNVLRGSAVSPGQITGEISLVMSPDEFHKMRPNTILVCPTTTPAWTQLFPQARGLATDIGGILAHGSIVAREYGIPAVLGLGDITKRVRDGQVITIDGDKGTVTLPTE
jgi:pyruvate,water dikinase